MSKLYLENTFTNKVSQLIGSDWYKKNIVLFGASSGAELFLEKHRELNLNIKYLVDNDDKKVNSKKLGFEIKHPASLLTENKDELLIIVTSMYYEAISAQLREYGFVENKNFIYGFNNAFTKIVCYIDLNIGLPRVINLFNEAGINYVVLRWFEQLPEWHGKDIDFLIDDKDISTVLSLNGITMEPKGIPCEIYCASGQGEGIPYFLSKNAEEILKNRVLYNDFCYVPSNKEYFFSLAYHVVYHKAEKAGIPEYITEEKQRELIAINRYANKLDFLANKVDIKDLKISLNGLVDVLDKHGWSPSIDVIRKYSIFNPSPWLRKLAMSKGSIFKKTDENVGELMVFIIRDWAIEQGLLPDIVDWFKENGLKIVDSFVLADEMRERAFNTIRGGNWGSDAWGISGGGPAALIVAYDNKPLPPTEQQMKANPFLSNQRYLLKKELREHINNLLGTTEKVNFIHSSDDEQEAWEYLNLISKEICLDIKTKLKQTV